VGILVLACEPPTHECINFEWRDDNGEVECGNEYTLEKYCIVCDKVVDSMKEVKVCGECVECTHECSEYETVTNFDLVDCGEEFFTYLVCISCKTEQEKIYSTKTHTMCGISGWNGNFDLVDCGEEFFEQRLCLGCEEVVNYRTHTKTHELCGISDWINNFDEIDCGDEYNIRRECLGCFEVIEIEVYTKTHDMCGYSEWEDNYDTAKCGSAYTNNRYCLGCSRVVDSKNFTKEHILTIFTEPVSCTVRYYSYHFCDVCDYTRTIMHSAAGHENYEYEVIKEATTTEYGIKTKTCDRCELSNTVEYAANTYSYHGELSVDGRDLVNSRGEKVQLIGISTHGLQWFSSFINYETFENMKYEFGINVVRLAMYTGENGYVTGNAARRQMMYDLVVKGIEIATQLDMYVIIDWHQVGGGSDAYAERDKNPLSWVNESMEFFYKISYQFRDYKNILYEIMNEPCGPTTWADCKEYANKVIPEIRKNSNGIVLVGNPRWSADLNSVMASPLVGYTNIMYTYHFYAADHKNTTQVVNAYTAGIPVFITEHGGMWSDGGVTGSNRDIDYTSIRNWYKVLDDRNISYVAWNLSNSGGSASIMKQNSSAITDFTDDNLKVWGRWYKIWTRTKAGLPVYGYVDEATEKS